MCPHVVIARCRWLIFMWGHWLVITCPGCITMLCLWCCIVLLGAGLLFGGAGLLFVRVVICGCWLLGVICRQVGQDKGGKGGAHQCHSINNGK